MLNACVGTVSRILSQREGIDRVLVDCAGEMRPSVSIIALCGSVRVGDRVLVNTTAVDLGLGTGGWDFVMAILPGIEGRRRFGDPTDGHLIKLRYTPMQMAVSAAEERDSILPETLEGRPIVVMELHSQLVPALIGLRRAVEEAGRPYPSAACVVPDAGALPLALSDTIPRLKEEGLLRATVTCGHAFGGDYEAVNIGSGLLVAAGSAGADVIFVAQGPGNAGTASPLGFGGLYQSEAVHLAASLDGDPILVPRWSKADPRPRHRGISHHTRTLLNRLIHVPVTVALPDPSAEETRGLPTHGESIGRKGTVAAAPSSALLAALRQSGLPLSSMGRSIEDDPIFFMTAAAGGWVAGNRLENPGE